MEIDKQLINIRPAEEKDLHDLYQFEQGVISAERPFDITLRPDPVSYYDLHAIMHSQDAQLLVAEFETRIIASGYAKLKKAEPFLQHEQYAYLGFMYVLPQYRGQGLNKLIVEELQNWALSKSVNEVRLEVYHDNNSAIRAYEKIGFSRHMIEMRIKVN